MGTNYYVVRNGPTVQDPIHIGKCSAGWLFLFQSHHDTWYDPPVVWESWPKVKEWLKRNTVDSSNYVIIDEYDRVMGYDDFVEMVEERQEDEFCKSNPDNFTHCRNVDGYRFTDGYFS